MGSLSTYHLFYYPACNPICFTSRFWFQYVSSVFPQHRQWVSADTPDVHFTATYLRASLKSAQNTENVLAVYLKEGADKHFCINQTRRGSQGYSNKPKHNLSRFTSHQTTTQLSLKTVTPVSFSLGHQKDQAQSSCCFDKVFAFHRGGSKQGKNQL